MSFDILPGMHNLEEMIGKGFSLVTIPYGQKRPLNKGWNRRENVIGSLDQVGQLAGMNIGLAHAYCTPSPTCAIDCDDVAEATIWLADHGIDLVALQNAPDAVGIISGKPNSSKLILKFWEKKAINVLISTFPLLTDPFSNKA